MKILLATPFMAQHADAGLFWAKALCEMGHSLILWEYRLNPEPPKADYDLALVLKGESIDPGQLKSPKVVYWPDALERTPGIEEILKFYDRVFTPVRPTPDWMEWLPTGWDPAIHRDLNIPRNINTLYIGTANSERKCRFLEVIQPDFIVGNGWSNAKFKDSFTDERRPTHIYGDRYDLMWNSRKTTYFLPPQYLYDLVLLANRTKVAIDIHQGPVGPNRKFFELIACGFTIVDRVPGVREILGDVLDSAVAFESPEHAKRLIEYYLAHPEERQKIWELEKKKILPYTYRAAAERVLNIK